MIEVISKSRICIDTYLCGYIHTYNIDDIKIKILCKVPDDGKYIWTTKLIRILIVFLSKRIFTNQTTKAV